MTVVKQLVARTVVDVVRSRPYFIFVVSSMADGTLYDVVVVGAGVSGVAAAHYLLNAGVPRNSIAILEKGARPGGTWFYNTYPGAACDVPSHFYSFSFALNPNWSRAWAPQAEILEYLEQVTAAECGDLVHLNTSVTSTVWDERARIWVISTHHADGTSGVVRARYVVAGPGALATPSTPDFPGKANFVGRSTHTATWDHSLKLDGLRIGVIGTGCSGACRARDDGDPSWFAAKLPWTHDV